MPSALCRVQSMSSVGGDPAKPGPSKGRRLLLVVLLMAGTGCASYRPTQTGYLSDYSRLEKDPIHLNYGLGLQRNLSHNAAPQEACQVDSFYIEPVQWLVPDSSRAAGDPRRQEVLTSILEGQLKEQLGTLKPIVDVPGPNTARVRSAITGVNFSRPLLNAAMMVTLITPVFVGPIFNGGGYVEAEVIGPDGRQISAISCASAGGIIDLYGFYNKPAHAKKAMRRSARELRQTLEP